MKVFNKVHLTLFRLFINIHDRSKQMRNLESLHTKVIIGVVVTFFA